MLTTIREKTQGWIAAIILGLVTIPFALWGINTYFTSGGGRLNVAEVNGIDISVAVYRRALDDQRRSLQQVLGRSADPRLFDTPEFRQRVLDGLIDEVLISADVEANGYRVSDTELSRQIRLAPQFQRDGQFDPKLYEALLRNAGLDVTGFEARLRRDVLVHQAESGYTQSAIVTPATLQTLLKLQAQQREATVAEIKPARLRERVTIGAQAIEQEYNANAERYQSPERIRVEYIRLDAADLAKDIHVSEDEVRKAMTESVASAAGKEERRASHILIKLPQGADAQAEKAAIAKAQDLHAKLLAGADFATLARKNSEDPGSAAQGGDLGFVSRGTLVKEFEQTLYALKKPGDLSAPVRTNYGVHLIKLTGIKAPSSAPTTARATVEAEIRARKAEERFFELSEKFHNLVYEQTDSLKPAAEVLGLKIETSGWFTRTGGGSGSGIVAEPKIIEAAFDPEVLTQGHNSSTIELGRNTLVALRIAAHEPRSLRPLAEVRAEIEKTLLARALQAEGERIAQEALGKLRAGESFESVARLYGMDSQATRLYARNATGTDAQLLAAVFKAGYPEGGKPVYGSAVRTDGGVAVFAVMRVIELEKLASVGAEADAIRKQVEARRGREYLDSYRSGLRQQAKIKIYKDQL
jgi:peptidyl-prolyl cis-trans isomerase D